MFEKWFLLMNGDGGAPEGGSGGTPEGASPSYGGATPLVPTNPLFDANFSEPTPQQTPASPVAPPTVEELDFAGRKVPVVDPVIKDIHRDYSNLARTYQETNTAYKQLQEQQGQMIQMVQYLQQQGAFNQQQQAQQPVDTTPTPEDNEAFMTQWYDSPKQTIQQTVQQAVQQFMESQVNPVIEPIQRERQFNQEIQALQQKYSDFQAHAPMMQQIIQANPQMANMGLETVYMIARGQQAQAAPTPEQMVNDPQYKQFFMNNEGFRNEVINQYLQTKQTANQQVPPVMGNQPGGTAPAMPENKPKSIREASRQFAQFLGY